MSFVNVKCDVCGTDVIFDEDVSNNPVATRYWKSTYEEPDESLFVVVRKIHEENKWGKVVCVQTLYEHILKIYCGVECGLEDYQKVENTPDIGDNTL